MIQKYNVTKVTGRNTKKDGTPLINKFQKPYFIIGLQCVQHGQTWINGFSDSIPQWEGKEIDLDIFEEEYNGTKSLKFKVPKAEEKNTQEVKSMLLDIQLRLGKMDSRIDAIYKAYFANRTSSGAPMPDFSQIKLSPEVEHRAALARGSFAAPAIASNDPIMTPEDEEAMNAAFDGLPM